MTRTLHSGQILLLVSNGLASVRGSGRALLSNRPHTNQVSENKEKMNSTVRCAADFGWTQKQAAIRTAVDGTNS